MSKKAGVVMDPKFQEFLTGLQVHLILAAIDYCIPRVYMYDFGFGNLIIRKAIIHNLTKIQTALLEKRSAQVIIGQDMGQNSLDSEAAPVPSGNVADQP